MEKATLTISLPRTMKDFIGKKLLEGRYSTPSEYIRSLIRDDQDLNGKGDIVAIVRRVRNDGVPPGQDNSMTGTGKATAVAPGRANRRRISAGRRS